jgi:hypothetical protein
MESFTGLGALYMISWWLVGEDNRDYVTFGGDRAFSEASDFYEALRGRRDVRELWFTRMDGGNWVLVSPPMKRDKRGDWVVSLAKFGG